MLISFETACGLIRIRVKLFSLMLRSEQSERLEA